MRWRARRPPFPHPQPTPLPHPRNRPPVRTRTQSPRWRSRRCSRSGLLACVCVCGSKKEKREQQQQRVSWCAADARARHPHTRTRFSLTRRPQARVVPGAARAVLGARHGVRACAFALAAPRSKGGGGAAAERRRAPNAGGPLPRATAPSVSSRRQQQVGERDIRLCPSRSTKHQLLVGREQHARTTEIAMAKKSLCACFVLQRELCFAASFAQPVDSCWKIRMASALVAFWLFEQHTGQQPHCSI